MVAELQQPAKKRKFFKAHSIPFATRATIRSLYVVHCKGPAEIAALVALPRQKICDLVHKNGWTQERDAILSKRERQQTEEIVRQAEHVNEVVAVRSEELTVRSLDLCSEALDAKDARALQLASSSARNLDQIRRAARNLDRSDQAKSGPTLNLAMFFTHGQATARPEQVNVTPAAPSLPV